MRRLKDYLGVLVWQSGLGYIALWAITYWSFDWGPVVFGRSVACHPDSAKVLFYWVCDPANPLAILSAVVNAALTITVWAPIYIAAATVRPDAVAIAVPIIAAHIIGLPTAIFVMMRVMLKFFELVRRMFAFATGRSMVMASVGAPAPEASATTLSVPQVPARAGFGLRGGSRRH
jgi:hypothetical protein